MNKNFRNGAIRWQISKSIVVFHIFAQAVTVSEILTLNVFTLKK